MMLRHVWPLALIVALCAAGCSRWNTLRDQVRNLNAVDAPVVEEQTRLRGNPGIRTDYVITPRLRCG